MTVITIYTTTTCPFCIRAKALLDSKKIVYTEIDVSTPEAHEAMRTRTAGRNSVPQIFFDDKHIGGCDDLCALEEKGALDALSR